MAKIFYLINGFPGTGKTYNAVLKFHEINTFSPNNVILTSNNIAPVFELSKRLDIPKGNRLRTIYGFATSACYHNNVFPKEEILKLNPKKQFMFWSSIAKKLGLSTADLKVALGLTNEVTDEFSDNSISRYLVEIVKYINKYPDAYDKELLKNQELDVDILNDLIHLFEKAIENYKPIHYIIPKLLAYKLKIDIFKLYKNKEALDVDYLIIDEAQNLGILDYYLIDLSNVKIVYLYGDLFQSIYDFIGLDYRTILFIENKHGFENIDTLIHSKRLAKNVANRLSNYILNHPDKNLISMFSKYSTQLKIIGENRHGDIFIIRDYELPKILDAFDDVVILVRRNKDIRRIEYFLSQYGILVDYLSEENKMLNQVADAIIQNDIKYLEQISVENKLAQNILKILNRYQQKTLVDFFKKEEQNKSLKDIVFRHKDEIVLGERLVELIKLKTYKKKTVFATTIHRFQGREAQNIVLFYDIKSNVNINIEYNVVFVGLSRAKSNVFVISNSKIYDYLKYV